MKKLRCQNPKLSFMLFEQICKKPGLSSGDLIYYASIKAPEHKLRNALKWLESRQLIGCAVTGRSKTWLLKETRTKALEAILD